MSNYMGKGLSFVKQNFRREKSGSSEEVIGGLRKPPGKEPYPLHLHRQPIHIDRIAGC
jgi:hypothetical protein